jgi:ABC-type dipeptide/oligopeptide/nickel transport system permease subunit
MTTQLEADIPQAQVTRVPEGRSETILSQILRNRRVLVGGGIMLSLLLLCIGTLPWTISSPKGANGATGISLYLTLNPDMVRHPPRLWPISGWFGYDMLGRSVLARCLVGGSISVAVGLAAAAIAVLLGVAVGLVAGFRGGAIDSILMRIVDVLYGLPYVLLVILFKVAFEQPLTWLFLKMGFKQNGPQMANLAVLFSAIGLVSWLTMARVIRGQVLSLRSQPFIEACRAMGLKQRRIFLRHILPNLVGPITVYATLTVPSAILQESFLSFLGVGVNPPLATWGSLASEGVEQLTPLRFYWWLLLFPCTLLAGTLLSLNFLGDGLRDVFDPKKEAAKI